MARYYVNRNPQANGDHEVHKAGCYYWPSKENLLYLGEFSNCHDAVREAKNHYGKSNGCYYCIRECHTG